MYSIILLVTSVKFSQVAYSVGENNRMVRIELVLSIPSSTNITVQVFNTDRSANGKYSLEEIKHCSNI